MSKTISSGLLISVIAISASVLLVLPAAALTPVNVSAGAAGQMDVGTPSDRIGWAFASLSEEVTDPAIEAAARGQKGDFAAPVCANAVWPDIDASCLATADGRPVRNVRAVTIGYQLGEGTTILLRMPAAEEAPR